jgi:ABC-type uncharacterized transport system auxiliary subunit
MHPLYKAIPLCFLLLSCSLFPQPAGSVSKYILTKPIIQPSSKKLAEKGIFVVQPSLSVALQDHNRVVYYPTPQKIEYLAGGEWAQKLDLMVGESLFEALKASHKFKTVLSDAAIADSLILKTHVAVVGIEQSNQQKKAHVAYEFSLFDQESKLISQKYIEQRVEIKDVNLDAVVSCLNTAHQKIIAEYVQTL